MSIGSERRSSPPRGGIEVVFVDLVQARALLDDAEREKPRLSGEDLARAAARAAQTGDAALWRASRIALRIVLERWAGPAIGQKPFVIAHGGRPRLADGLPAFSHAHSGGAALIAVQAHDPIGVDLEQGRLLNMSAERRARVVAAATALAPDAPLTGDDTQRCLQAWVRLEAVAKASGAGIGATLTDAGVVGPRQGRRSAHEGVALEVRDIDVRDGYFAAVAAAALPPELAITPFPGNRDELHHFIGADAAA